MGSFHAFLEFLLGTEPISWRRPFYLHYTANKEPVKKKKLEENNDDITFLWPRAMS